MKNQTSSNDQIYQQLYLSLIKSGFFIAQANLDSTKNSTEQLQEIEKKSKNANLNTFKICATFNVPNQYHTHSQNTQCHIENLKQQSFFSKVLPKCLQFKKVSNMSLTNTKLIITSGNKIQLYLDFNAVHCILIQKQPGFILNFKNHQDQIYIQQKQVDSSKKFINLIRQLIQKSSGYVKNFNYLPNTSPIQFYKIRHLLNAQFAQYANTLDLVLFQTKYQTQQLIYDHVGMVFRNNNNQLFILQCVKGQGISFMAWQHFITFKWYQRMKRVYWKKLNMRKTSKDNYINIIQSYLVHGLSTKNTKTHRTVASLKQLLKIDNIYQQYSQINSLSQMQNWSSAQLIARIYKQLKIISIQKQPNQFTPFDFSDLGKLKIIRDNTQLDNQQLIAFDFLPPPSQQY